MNELITRAFRLGHPFFVSGSILQAVMMRQDSSIWYG